MNLKFMDRALSEKHRELGLYIEQNWDKIYLMRLGTVLAEFDSRAPCQSLVDRADQYLGEITAGITFERSVK